MAFPLGKVDAPQERRYPMFVPLERELNVSLLVNIQSTVRESQI